MKLVRLAIIGLLGYSTVFAQAKVEPRIDIMYTYINGQSPAVGVKVRKRIDRRYYPIAGVQTILYFQDEDDESEIGVITTDGNGFGSIEIPARLLSKWKEMSEFELYAKIHDSDSLVEASESVAIKKARVSLDGKVDDESKTVIATVEKFENDEWSPAGDVELKIFIKRDFGRLPIGEDSYSTDEEGSVKAGFETEIPGDEKGNIVVGAFVEDHEDFGSLFAYKELKWGVPTIDDNTEFNERNLWSTRDKTPIWLLVFPNLIIIGVWGTIGYLVLQIFKLKKLSKQN